ncbi:ATP-binding protein [Leifsonia flava]|uniref:Uncharacterized protein n=1 Tax=Orlajensenia leifsoniae TaxID=2561933 RepID=A0A4Y9QQK2_9MICO|nr:SbcC/MukB-like Walker B domain-containing protein [Leifsonia flava]TFV94879.1 hypothetical protein E4M00_17140 [Leifsonia flava]
MTMIDTLFGLIPAASRGQQWLAEELQLINWGGYDNGPHRIRFSPAATLLCGGSGSGKSTLMDANVALMMPHTTPFNGASNGGVTGRPRGADQRNILSYGRGKTDETRTEDGTKLTVLRGDGSDTWSAIAMTWVDHDGSRFTAVRAWYIPAGARLIDDTVKVRATVNGAIRLGVLERAAEQRLSDASVKAAGFETFSTDKEFSARLHNVLGIGAAGSGAKAISLLARIQAGQQITTVDDLYKRMVLEEPETLSTADAVVAHFDRLEGTRNRMVNARQQVQALTPIRGMRTRIEEAAERLRVIDAVGRFSDPSSLASLWRANRRLEMLRAVEDELRASSRTAEALVRETQALAEAAELERDSLNDVLRAAGGDRLETANRELRGALLRLADVEREHARLEEALTVLEAKASTAKEFDSLTAAATKALGSDDAKTTAREAFVEASSTSKALRVELSSLEAERRKAVDRKGNISERLHESRALLAAAAGLTLEDLPFVGELVEVRTEFEPWREAFNLALGGFATTLLIDVAHLTAFRSAIESVRTADRLRYEGVHVGMALAGDGDLSTLPGRLDHKGGQFTGWLQDRLAQQYAFVCVDSPRELSQHRMALTITGQTSQGNRGAHGGHGRANVLGYSNQRYLADLDARIEATRVQANAAKDAADEANLALDTVEERHAAYRTVRGLTWDQVDVTSVEQERDRWTGIIEEVTAGNPEIADLKAQIKMVSAKATSLREDIGGAKKEQERLAQLWANVTDEVDAAQIVIDDAENAKRDLSDDQSTYLDAQFLAPDTTAEATPSKVLDRFDAALASAARRLEADQQAAIDQLGEQRDALRRTMTAFLERWPNPNMLADPEQSFADFDRILVELETSGFHDLQDEWRDSLLKLSGNDLTSLDSKLGQATREIRDRIEPINAIMRDLPFYDDDHRLQITLSENQSEVRKRFRRELRDVRAAIDAATTDDEREQVYGRMAKLISRMRRTSPDFEELVDVRNHVRVSAERILAATNQHVALYDHIGEKSGGESQELIAFIVGAALRYQLGDAGAERPRYAPVFLDEALIKADAHFTARAIGAWRGLGFQLIIGAPNDKYSAIEPHVDVEYDILKDTKNRSWAKLKVGLPEQSA